MTVYVIQYETNNAIEYADIEANNTQECIEKAKELSGYIDYLAVWEKVEFFKAYGVQYDGDINDKEENAN